MGGCAGGKDRSRRFGQTVKINVIKSPRTETIKKRIDRILESLDLLRLKWCSEPSVHGGKKTAPSAG